MSSLKTRPFGDVSCILSLLTEGEQNLLGYTYKKNIYKKNPKNTCKIPDLIRKIYLYNEVSPHSKPQSMVMLANIVINKGKYIIL